MLPFDHRALLAAFILLVPTSSIAAGAFDIGLGAAGTRIDAFVIDATDPQAPTVVMVGGIAGKDQTTDAVHAAIAAYDQRDQRPVRLLAVPLANPDGSALAFPPAGTAYRENIESHSLWRWLGAQAPDLVLVAGSDAGLVSALGTEAVAQMGSMPARRWSTGDDWLPASQGIATSDARRELERRQARTPRQLATELAQHYGREFDQPWYISAMALQARIRLGDIDDVQRLAERWVDGSQDSLARPNALVMAGHILFTDLARETGDARYTAAVRRVADLGFDAAGGMLESMPHHDGYSDSVFMGTVIAAQAGALTGDRRYFDLADRHLRFMQDLVLRPDGLYRHRSSADVPWGRGNGFAAIGLAMTLPELPQDHPGYAHALHSYRSLMAALLPLQTRDGLWRNVVNHPGAFAELSGTAMIGFAMLRGLANGWIDGADYAQAVEHAWLAVNSRTASNGGFIDVCESTARLTTLDEYLHRAAILGEDPRGGAMALLFATEMDRGTGAAGAAR